MNEYKRQFDDYSVIEKAYIFTAYYNDFDENFSWQKSYFELLSWKNTWDLCYDLDILSSRKDGAFVRIVTKAKYNIKENMMKALDELGYRNVVMEEAKVRIYDPYDIWEEDFDNEVYEHYVE